MIALKVIDSHTEGEPTRVIISGGPDLGSGPLAARARRFAAEHDALRSAVCNEPRGHEAMVGALLGEPCDAANAASAIYFNNVGLLNMCIHATIGVAVTLAHLGRIGPGRHGIETPVGTVFADLTGDGLVTVANVPSHRHLADVAVEVPGWGEVRGDVAWGGNWFFLVDRGGSDISLAKLDELTRFTRAIRQALSARGITGDDGREIDHIEVFGPPADPLRADCRNFVLCPGDAYDRSPCGTGTSAKLACLHADGKLAPGETWRQAGILDTIFEGRYRELGGGRILPSVSGRAWITGESTYHFDPTDPFRHGIPDPRSHALSSTST